LPCLRPPAAALPASCLAGPSAADPAPCDAPDAAAAAALAAPAFLPLLAATGASAALLGRSPSPLAPRPAATPPVLLLLPALLLAGASLSRSGRSRDSWRRRWRDSDAARFCHSCRRLWCRSTRMPRRPSPPPLLPPWVECLLPCLRSPRLSSPSSRPLSSLPLRSLPLPPSLRLSLRRALERCRRLSRLRPPRSLLLLRGLEPLSLPREEGDREEASDALTEREPLPVASEEGEAEAGGRARRRRLTDRWLSLARERLRCECLLRRPLLLPSLLSLPSAHEASSIS